MTFKLRKSKTRTNIPSFTEVTSFQTRIHFFNRTHTVFKHPLRTSWSKITMKQHKDTIIINHPHDSRMSLYSQSNGVGLLGLADHCTIFMLKRSTIQLTNKEFIWFGYFQEYLKLIVFIYITYIYIYICLLCYCLYLFCSSFPPRSM